MAKRKMTKEEFCTSIRDSLSIAILTRQHSYLPATALIGVEDIVKKLTAALQYIEEELE